MYILLGMVPFEESLFDYDGDFNEAGIVATYLTAEGAAPETLAACGSLDGFNRLACISDVEITQDPALASITAASSQRYQAALLEGLKKKIKKIQLN